MTILPPNIRIFPFFLGISLTEKPVDRNTCFCWHVAECFFRRGGLSFRIFTQNKLGVRAFRATKCQNIWRENLHAQRTFGVKLHKSNFESRDGTRSMKY